MTAIPRRLGQHAIVIGASLGGLVAARALADAFSQVTLVERDAFPPRGQNRKGVPQGFHAHALLARGREALDDLFPGLTEALLQQGALTRDLSADLLWFNHGGYHQQAESGLHGLALSRPLLEGEVRARLLAHPNVRALESCDVLGLAASADHSRITGVRVIRRAAGSSEEVLAADLVVDASGRGSRSPAWLEALGYPRPPEGQVRVGVGYATRYYRWDPQNPATRSGLVLAGQAPSFRGGVILRQEGGRFVATLGGYLGDHPPTDEAGFLEFARSLPTSEFYNAISSSEPLSEIQPFKYPANLRRRYDRLQRFPAGYLVFGDAFCSFNPIYGQGMTSSSLQALALRDSLAAGLDGLARRFFAKASRIVDIPWSMAVGNDLRHPEVEGSRDAQTHFINWYVGRLHIAARRDARLSQAFLKVINLAAPPLSLLQPASALRVLWGNLRQPAPVASPAARLSPPASSLGVPAP